MTQHWKIELSKGKRSFHNYTKNKFNELQIYYSIKTNKHKRGEFMVWGHVYFDLRLQDFNLAFVYSNQGRAQSLIYYLNFMLCLISNL